MRQKSTRPKATTPKGFGRLRQYLAMIAQLTAANRQAPSGREVATVLGDPPEVGRYAVFRLRQLGLVTQVGKTRSARLTVSGQCVLCGQDLPGVPGKPALTP